MTRFEAALCRRRHGYGQVNPTESGQIRLGNNPRMARITRIVRAGLSDSIRSDPTQSDSIRPDPTKSDRMRPDTDCKCTMVRAVERTFQSVFSIRPKTGMCSNPAHAPFVVGKLRPICFHAPMAGGPTHSKFTVQGSVSGKEHWFRVCALRGDEVFAGSSADIE